MVRGLNFVVATGKLFFFEMFWRWDMIKNLEYD
jgi:hypothetical protein